MMVVIVIMMLAALVVLVEKTGDLVAASGRRLSATDLKLTQIQYALVSYTTFNGYLPCPADPTGAASAGVANGGAAQPAGVVCTYPTGVVPWRTIGLTQPEVTDEWGRMVSYRVYDGTFGLVQPNGMNATNCDTTNALTGNLGVGAAAEMPPTVNGLCDTDPIKPHNTLAASFITYSPSPSYQKGLTVLDFGTTITDAAYVLISHGPTGRGAYLPTGERVAVPNANAADLPNTQAPPAQFVRTTHSARDISPDMAGHYDDIVGYLRINDLLRLANRSARDWPDSMLNADTTASMTSASLNPAAPHFISSGATAIGQTFSTTDGTGTVVQAGTGVGAFSACLWWPNSLTLVNGSFRQKLVAYLEFAATDNTSDALPGFTIGFLPANDPAAPPVNSTCGTGIAATTTATGNVAQTNIVVADVTGIAVGHRVFGIGIPFNAVVWSITPLTRTIQLSANLTTTITNATVSFADGLTVRRDLGWNGGTLASFADRFAVEFDAVQDTATAGPPAVATANDPIRPHLAIDFGGTIHTSTAESCTTTRSGLPCDSQVTSFPAETIAATGTAGGTTIIVSAVHGIVHGMTVTAASGVIPISTTVRSISETPGTDPRTYTVTLSNALTGALAGNVTFALLSTANFMQNGMSVFHTARVEVSPKNCTKQTATGSNGATTITVTDGSPIQTGMSVYGIGIATGAKVSSVAGTTVTLNDKNTSAVSGSVIFAANAQSNLTQTLVEAWTLSNVGCMQDSVSCGAIKDLSKAFSTGNKLEVVAAATGSSGINVITLNTSVAAIIPHMSVTGTGIAANAYVVSVSGTTITLSANNTAAVSSNVVFRNRQALHAVSCVPAATTATAYDTLYYGLTTASLTTGTVTTKTATGVLGGSTITVSSNTLITVGMAVRGAGIGDNAVVTGITGTLITLNSPNKAAMSGASVTFSGGSNVMFRNVQIQNLALP